MSPHGTTKIGTLTLTCFYCTVNLTEMIVDTQYIFLLYVVVEIEKEKDIKRLRFYTRWSFGSHN